MTDIQLPLVIGIPLIGILSNTALYIALSGRMENRFKEVRDEFKLIRSEAQEPRKEHRDDMKTLQVSLSTLSGVVYERMGLK